MLIRRVKLGFFAVKIEHLAREEEQEQEETVVFFRKKSTGVWKKSGVWKWKYLGRRFLFCVLVWRKGATPPSVLSASEGKIIVSWYLAQIPVERH